MVWTSSRLAPWRRAAELGDVGAGDERAAVADQHDGLGVARDRRLEALEEAVAHVDDSAFTGGEFSVTMATSPSWVSVVTSLIWVMERSSKIGLSAAL
jgi:hypothetical protein